MGVGAPLINQSHQLSGLTKTRDPVSLGGWEQGGCEDHPMGFGEGKDDLRGGILLTGTCLKPPKTTGVCVAGEGLRKFHNCRS